VTDIHHIRCDRCGTLTIFEPSREGRAAFEDWARVKVGIKPERHFCPACWDAMVNKP
jgi:hypothetical protein